MIHEMDLVHKETEESEDSVDNKESEEKGDHSSESESSEELKFPTFYEETEVSSTFSSIDQPDYSNLRLEEGSSAFDSRSNIDSDECHEEIPNLIHMGIQQNEVENENLPVAFPVRSNIIDNTETSTINGVLVINRKCRYRLIAQYILVALLFALVLILVFTFSPFTSPDISTITSAPSTSPSTIYEPLLREIILTAFDEDVIDDPTSREHWLLKEFSTGMGTKVAMGYHSFERSDLILQEYIFSVIFLTTGSKEFFDNLRENKRPDDLFPPICDFLYVRCNDEDIITTFIQQNEWQQRGGVISSAIGLLTSLEHIILTRNALIGSIPSEIGLLKQLRSLVLDNNNLTGSIPKEIGQLQKLEYFSIKSNMIENKIPSFMGNVTILCFVGLSDNRITGHIPPSFEHLQRLKGLELQNNEITGDVGFLCDALVSHNITEKHLFTINEVPLSLDINPGIVVDIRFQNVSECTCCIFV